MPSADVVVVGAGLSGLTAAIAAADAGARVDVIAAGLATTHWTAGGVDVAAIPGAGTPLEGITRLAAEAGHPYAVLAQHLPAALQLFRDVVWTEGLGYTGGLDDPLRPVPTAIGVTRPAAILPDGQAAALAPWSTDEHLVVCGPAGFKDFWPSVVASGLARETAWPGWPDRPARVEALTVEWPGLADRHNLSARTIARHMDDVAWRRDALERVARALDRHRRGPVRIAMPATLGLEEHAAVLEDAARILPGPVFEVPLVPPSIPGLRLFHALRGALRRRGGRIVVGEPVVRVDIDGGRVVAVSHSAAARGRTIRTGALVLATGGIAGGGLVGEVDGTIRETVLGLPVASPQGPWLADDPFEPSGHPIELAGIRTDAALRPIARGGTAVFENVSVVGSLLAGQRYLAQRCGDGVAIASGWHAAQVLAGRPVQAPVGAGTP